MSTPLWRLPLILLLSLAGVWRACALAHRVFSHDESFSWRMLHYPLPDFLARMSGDGHPPLHYLLLRGWASLVGSSGEALRAMSLLFGVGLLVQLFLLCRDPEAADASERPASEIAALFAVALAAVSVMQIVPAATARMYGMGAFFVALTSWLLLRAIVASAPPPLSPGGERGEEKLAPLPQGEEEKAPHPSPLAPLPQGERGVRWGWWTAYGLAVAAFCYTHYYAFFTVFAQTLFVIGDLLVRWRRSSLRAVLPAAGGFIFAGIIALLLYAPWFPVFAVQTRDVYQGFWIEQISLDRIEHNLFLFLTGMDYQDEWFSRLWMLALAGLIGWTLWRGGRTAWLFFLLAFVPWACGIGISLLSGRPILHDRYLVFAQVGLLALWSVSWRCLPGWPARIAFAWIIGSTCVYGLVEHLEALPDRPCALEKAADFIREQHRPGDVFLVDGNGEINQFRYYTTQAGLPWLDVKARVDILAKGHLVHVASLCGEEVYDSAETMLRTVQGRVWRVTGQADGVSLPWEGRQAVLVRTFEGGGIKVGVVMYESPQTTKED